MQRREHAQPVGKRLGHKAKRSKGRDRGSDRAVAQERERAR